MNFQKGRAREEPEINLIAMIDVLLVILIFMLVTTTYSKHAELQINLPQASGSQAAAAGDQINVAIDATEHYAINNKPTKFDGVNSLSQALRKAAGNQTDPTIVISADAKAPHQSVINIMEAARLAGYGRITFTTQSQD
ncbi:MAG TPA: biopolymer transporter ExbD [Gallionellaceae bacterium]|nr:biopolymer transporter ExbD [Gallionellaceae bacterium]